MRLAICCSLFASSRDVLCWRVHGAARCSLLLAASLFASSRDVLWTVHGIAAACCLLFAVRCFRFEQGRAMLGGTRHCSRCLLFASSRDVLC